MAPWIIPALVVIGLILLYLEFFLPGGILGIASAVVLVISVVLVFQEYGTFWGMAASLGLLIVVTGVLRYWMATFHRSLFGKRISNLDEVGDDEFLTGLRSLVGKTGRTTTEVHPSGKADIEGVKYDVVAAIGTIPAGTQIEVQAVEGLRIIVSPVETE